MSTSFKVKTQRTDISFITRDTHFSAEEEPDIAFRFFRGGPNPGSEVRFAFPRELASHLRDTVLCGSDGSQTTIGELFDKAVFVDFLKPEQAADTFLCWGSDVRQNGKDKTA